MTEVELRIRVDEDADFETAQHLAGKDPEIQFEASTGTPGVKIEGQIAPVVAVLIGAGVLAAAKFVMNWWETRRGGLVIDQRPDAKDDIYRDRDVEYGYILVFPKDGGKVELQTKDTPKDAIQQLLEAVISGVFDTVGELAKIAKEKLGSDKVEESAPTA